MDALARYHTALALGNERSESAAQKLIAMLSDTERCTLDEGMSVYDVEPTYGVVADAAHQSLARTISIAWPTIVEALPSAAPDLQRTLLWLLGSLSTQARAALPDDAHATIVEAARACDADVASAERDRDTARRTRANEFDIADETFWREQLTHPYSPRRLEAVIKLRDLVHDKAALARELVPLLRDAALRSTVTHALTLLPRLPPDIVRTLAASELPGLDDSLLIELARYGEPARALVPLGLARLRDTHLRDAEPWERPAFERDCRWRFATDALVHLVDVLDADEVESGLAALTESEHDIQRACARRLRDALAARAVSPR